MNVALCGAKLQSSVDGTEVSTTAIASEWLKKDSEAILMICATVDRKILERLINSKTSKETWDKIALVHARVASQTMHQLQLKYYSSKVTELGGV